MKTFTRLIILVLITGFYSCKQNEQPKVVDGETTIEQETDFQFPAVSLNDGQLWQANAETTQGIKNMQQLVGDFSIENGNSEELIAQLKAEFAMIFKKCTMTGAAHEQLHNYLIPLKTKIDSLSDGITAEKIEDYQSYLKDYFNYFQ
jgi:hypothetical protein